MPAVDLLWTYLNTWGDDENNTTIVENFNLTPSPNPQDPHLISMINEIRFTITPTSALAVKNYLTDSILAYKLTIGGQVWIDYNVPAADVWENSQNISPLSLLTKKAGGDMRFEPFITKSGAAVDVVMFWELPVGITPTGQQIQINQQIAALGKATADWAGEDVASSASYSWKVWGRYGVAEKTFRYGSFQKEIFSDSGETRPITLTQQQDMTILGVLVSQDSVSDDLTEAHIRDGAVNQKPVEMLRYLNGDYTNYIEVINPDSKGHETDGTGSPEDFMYCEMAQITGQMWFNPFGWPANADLTLDVKSTGSTYFLPLYCAPMGAGNAGTPPQQFQQVGNVAQQVVRQDSSAQTDQVSSRSGGNSRGGVRLFGRR